TPATAVPQQAAEASGPGEPTGQVGRIASTLPATVPARALPPNVRAGTATPAAPYRGDDGIRYRYEEPTATNTITATSISMAIHTPEETTAAPTWPYTIGGGLGIVIGCILMVIDHKRRATGMSEEPML
ncbi:hypothetical protein K2Z83_06075, partial [Oscillochloris sp. ZM17-4]